MTYRIKEGIRLVWLALKKVLARPGYIGLALGVALSVLALAIWLPNLSFIWRTIVSSSLAFGQKVSILGSSFGALQTNFSFVSRTLTISVALLFGINVSFLVFYLRHRMRLQRSAGTSIGGMLSGFIGVGCASCGSIILSSIFGFGATAGFLGLLPLRGQEFSIISLGILGFSIFLTAKKIQDPLVCKPKLKSGD
jgi:hypothetical protein